MNAFLKPMEGLDGFKELDEAVRSGAGLRAATGCTDAQKPHLIYAVSRACTNGRLIVVPGETRARELLEAFRFFDPNVKYFPAKDILFYQSDIRGIALTQERMEVYRSLLEGEHPTVITTFDALMDRLVPPQVMESFRLTIAQCDTVDLDDLRSRLSRMGYEYADQTEEPAVETFGKTIDLEVDAYIPPDYIENEYQKLDIYKRIAAIRTIEERDEMLDELIDRFGEPPHSVQNLMAVSMLREQAHDCYVTEIKDTPDGIVLSLFERAQIDPAKIPEFVKSLHPRISFRADRNNPRFVYRRQRTDPGTLELVGNILNACREICIFNKNLL